MVSKRANPQRVKKHRSYSVPELADCLGVHKNTVNNWCKDGLQPLDGKRPVLFHGEAIRAFLKRQSASRKRPCPAGTLYCFKCREPRPPALGMVDFVSINAMSGDIRAICATCETVMHRRACKEALASVMPGCDIQYVEAPSRLIGRSLPSLDCESERQPVT